MESKAGFFLWLRWFFVMLKGSCRTSRSLEKHWVVLVSSRGDSREGNGTEIALSTTSSKSLGILAKNKHGSLKNWSCPFFS